MKYNKINFKNFKADDKLKYMKALDLACQVMNSNKFLNWFYTYNFKNPRFDKQDTMSEILTLYFTLDAVMENDLVKERGHTWDYKSYWVRNGYKDNHRAIWHQKSPFNRQEIYSLAGTIAHEIMHCFFYFHHGRYWWCYGRKRSVPYATGYFVCAMAKELNKTA